MSYAHVLIEIFGDEKFGFKVMGTLSGSGPGAGVGAGMGPGAGAGVGAGVGEGVGVGLGVGLSIIPSNRMDRHVRNIISNI